MDFVSSHFTHPFHLKLLMRYFVLLRIAAFSSSLFGSGENVASCPYPWGFTPGAFVPRFVPSFFAIFRHLRG
ncbi:hypothetical protein GFC29_553 [Anoxybacillus sp. B7M1]|nr:hypothetical protein GFC28_1074 [Anoxybacillus sp. B2M1]ANB63401.1 hypothetical protein GFC29_553 [Anoxybacillus sp. B7M1]